MKKFRNRFTTSLVTSLVIVLIFQLHSAKDVYAIKNQEGNKDNGCESRINLPWQEFKALLKLDKDEIELTLEELNRLLQQTDPKLKPEYRLVDGKIILSRTEFKKILDHMEALPLDEEAPVKEYLLTKAIYKGRMGHDDFTFTADFTLVAFKEQAYLKIPVLPASLALKSMTVNERPAIIMNEGGYHCLVIDKPGEYNVTALFSIKSSLDKGPHKLRFPIQEVPITLIDLEIPATDIEVEMASAQYLETHVMNGRTSVKAVLAACRSFDFQWKKKVVSAERVPAMIYAESHQLISVEDDGLKINQDIFYNILQSGVDVLKLAVSEGMTILSVSGSGVGDWHEITEEGRRLLFIPLDYEQKGQFTIMIHAQKSFPDNSTIIEFAGLEVLDTVNGMGEKGYIGVELKTGAELVLAESSGLERVMVKKLSGTLFQKSTNPLTLGFRYLKHPYHLVMDIQKHEKVALPQAIIDSASVVSFFTEDGLVIHKVEYVMKNQLKQSLQLKLPERALIWSAIVGQESVEIRQDKDVFYVPLIISRQLNNQLEPFTIEIIYYTESPEFGFRGQRHITLPQTDLTISQVLWSIYLPEKYIYYRMITNLEKEALARGLTPILNRDQIKVDLPGRDSYEGGKTAFDSTKTDVMQDYPEKRGKTTFRNIDISSSMMSQQVMNAFNFDNRLHQIEDKMIQGETRVHAGINVLPMNIQIPASGQLYHFAKNIVRDEALEMTIHYVKDTIFKAIAWFGILVFIFLIILWRHHFKSFCSSLADKIKKVMQFGIPRVKTFFLSKWSLPVLGLVFLFSLSLGALEMLVCFLALWIAAMIHLDKRIKKSRSKMNTKFLIILLFAFSCLMVWMRPSLAYSQNSGQPEGPQVSLDWNEFKTHLGLDRDEIILYWDEFQKIISQTSKRAQLVYTIQNGKVRLSREQFDNLLKEMVLPRQEVPAPVDYRLTKAVYQGKMTENWTTITADFILEVMNKEGYQFVPFLPSQLGLQEVKVNEKPALLLTDGGYHKLIVKDPGHYRIKAVFYMKSSLNEANYQVSIPVYETSITLLELEIPLKDITVKAPDAQKLSVFSENNATRVSAVFPPTNHITIQWYGKKVLPAIQKVPAKIYAQSYCLVSIDDDALKVAMDIECNVLHAGIDELELLIPEGLNILSVDGQGVGEWRERRQDNQRILYIHFDYEHKGIFWLTIEYEKTLLEATNRFSFSTLKVLKAMKDMGYLGLELRSSAEVKVIDHEGMEKIAVQKLPSYLFKKSLKPLIFGFKYLKHPYHLELDIQRHPKVSVTMAVIDAANAVSFFTEDGKIVHRLIYEVRNQLKQFLKINLPEEAELWSVFVGDKPSEPAREKDLLYIPLIRSQEEGQRLMPFKIELVYYQKAAPFSAYGRKSVLLPQVTEIMVSKILWSLYLPKDYDFLYFSGTLEKERLASGIRPIMGCSCFTFRRAHRLDSIKSAGKLESPMRGFDEEGQTLTEQDKRRRPSEKEEIAEFQRFKASRKDMMKQQAIEKGFAPGPKEISEPQKPQAPISKDIGGVVSGYDTAVMSIPVSIPLSGQLYRFGKTVARQEPLAITMVYTQDWIMSTTGWLIFLLIAGLLFVLRKKICGLGEYLQKTVRYIEAGFTQSKLMIRKAYNATVTPLILLGFVIAAVFTAHLLSAFLLFLAGLCIVVHQSPYWFPQKTIEKKPRSAREKKPPEPPSPEVKVQPQKRRWLKGLLLSLGIIVFALGWIIFAISSKGRYRDYRTIFFLGVLVLLYYIALLSWWLMMWLINKIRHRKKE